jgi:hypothetical protein
MHRRVGPKRVTSDLTLCGGLSHGPVQLRNGGGILLHDSNLQLAHKPQVRVRRLDKLLPKTCALFTPFGCQIDILVTGAFCLR